MHELDFERFTKSSSYVGSRSAPNQDQDKGGRKRLSYGIACTICVLLMCAVVVIVKTDQRESTFDDLVTTGGAVRRNFLVGATEIQVKSCSTPQCKGVTKYIRDSLDESIDPCDDFYKFSCGNWIKHNPIPKTSSSFSTFSKLNQKVEKQLRKILEKPNKSSRENFMYKKAKNYYTSCRDMTAINALKATPLVDLINAIGGWAMGGQGVVYDEDKYDVMKILKDIHKDFTSSGGPLFSVHVSDDPKHTHKHIIEVRLHIWKDLEWKKLLLLRKFLKKENRSVKISSIFLAFFAIEISDYRIKIKRTQG